MRSEQSFAEKLKQRQAQQPNDRRDVLLPAMDAERATVLQPAAGAPAAARKQYGKYGPGEYEAERLDTIAQNNGVLQSLPLDSGKIQLDR